MPRGTASEVGSVMTSANGYHYTRTEERWRLTHHLLAEEELGRPLDTAKEMVRFADGDKTNLTPENIIIIQKNKSSVRKRLAIVEAHIAEYTAERDSLLRELERP